MQHQRVKRRHILGSTAIFIASTVVASTMLLVALLLYISELTGSMLLSLCIVGGSAAVVAFGIYIGSIRPYALELQEQIETIYEVSSRVKSGYDWVVDRVLKFLTDK